MKKSELREVISNAPIIYYTDYKPYLESIYERLRARGLCDSLIAYSGILGLGKGNVSWLIIKGRRKITRRSAEKILAALDPGARKEAYFRAMVDYTNAKTEADSNRYMAVLNEARQPLLSEEEVIDGQMLSDWLISVLREYVGLKKVRPDPAWIAKKFHLKIPAVKVKNALSLLERIGLIKYSRNKNRYLLTEKDFSPRVSNFAIMTAYRNYFEKAMESLHAIHQSERDYQIQILALSEENYKRARQILLEAQDKILSLEASRDDEDARIYQMGHQIFPCTKK